MDKISAEKRIEKLRKEIVVLRNAYHVENDPAGFHRNAAARRKTSGIAS